MSENKNTENKIWNLILHRLDRIEELVQKISQDQQALRNDFLKHQLVHHSTPMWQRILWLFTVAVVAVCFSLVANGRLLALIPKIF